MHNLEGPWRLIPDVVQTWKRDSMGVLRGERVVTWLKTDILTRGGSKAMEKIQVFRGAQKVGTFPLGVRQAKGLTLPSDGTSGPLAENEIECVKIEGELFAVLPSLDADKVDPENAEKVIKGVRRVVLPA